MHTLTIPYQLFFILATEDSIIGHYAASHQLLIYKLCTHGLC